MSGIYVHIPFCKKACHYCNFHFSTLIDNKDDLFQCILKELDLRKNYLNNEKLNSIYLGGGTPSLLTVSQLNELYEVIQEHFNVSDQMECTLEANPDDLTIEYVSELSGTFINRLSIGVQSFFDDDLKWMNRSHNADQAETCIKVAQDYGLDNISIDLIYGFPTLSNDKWKHNLSMIETLDIQHFSAYCLTVEEKTALYHQIKMGKQTPLNDEQASEQFQLLMNEIQSNDWLHYEISNIATHSEHQAIHNSNYWKGEKYLGVGPSAHSYNGRTRQWNVANNAIYLSTIKQGTIPFEEEVLTPIEKANEYIMTSLRTMWGCSLLKLHEILKKEIPSYWFNQISIFVEKGWISYLDQKLVLTQQGKFFADHIASELFFIEE